MFELLICRYKVAHINIHGVVSLINEVQQWGGGRMADHVMCPAGCRHNSPWV